jgi:uncharacterized membrane protein YraQ (UPF0718 family)
MGAFAQDWATAIWSILAESGPYLLLGFFVAGVLKVWIPAARIMRHLGGDDLPSVTKAAVLGAPLPLCSCAVIPTAAGLREAGASKGATASFLIATPETGVDSIGITYALMDPIFTALRPLAAILTAIVSGTLVNGLVKRGKDVGGEPVETEPSCCASNAGAEAAPAEEAPAPPPEPGRMRRAFSFAYGKLMEDLTPWFLLGFLLSGLITVLVPDDFFGGRLTSGFPAMLAMLVLSTPMYICATASTPIAVALVAKGLDPGAALVLLLAGPATNLTTILVVRQFLGGAVLRMYLLALVVCSLALGFLTNLLYGWLDLDLAEEVPDLMEMEHGWLATASGAVLLALLAWHAWRLWGPGGKKRRPAAA